MLAGFAEIKRVACLPSLTGTTHSSNSCCASIKTKADLFTRHGQGLPPWIVSVGAEYWVQDGQRQRLATGNAAAASQIDTLRLQHKTKKALQLVTCCTMMCALVVQSTLSLDS